MKRLAVATAMIVTIIAISVYSLHVVQEMRRQMTSRIGDILACVERDDGEALERNVQELCDYWHAEQHRLGHFVRHSHVDEITLHVSRLCALAQYREDSELVSELSIIIGQVEHIWSNEVPSFRNIFRISAA